MTPHPNRRDVLRYALLTGSAVVVPSVSSATAAPASVAAGGGAGPPATTGLVGYPRPAAEIPPSEKYRVTVTQGSTTLESFVYMTSAPPNAVPDLPTTGMWPVLTDRTFSWTTFSFAGTVTVQVTKIYGTGATDIQVTPRSYGITPTISDDGRTVTFTLDRPRKVSVNFRSDDNKDLDLGSELTRGQIEDHQKQIRNGLMIFADPLEEAPPTAGDPGVLSYTPATTLAQIQAADTIHFGRGVHDLNANPELVRTDNNGVPMSVHLDGVLPLRDGQTVYLAGGSYVYGALNAVGRRDVTIRGRGVLSGAKDDRLMWKATHLPMIDLRHMNRGSHAYIEGVTLVDPPFHGMVTPPNTVIRDTKQIGWRTNNDGIRSQNDTLVQNCFIKTADDFFYAFSTTNITGCVLWPMWNGATFMLGWGDYGGKGTRVVDNDIINPEWGHLHSNLGIVAAQILPASQNGDILVADLRVDGAINALANLHFKDPMPANTPQRQGEIGHITFRNISIQHPFVTDHNTMQPTRNLVRGVVHQDRTYYTHDISFENVSLAGEVFTEENRADHTLIDAATTYNISMRPEANPLPVNVSLKALTESLYWDTADGGGPVHGRQADRREAAALRIFSFGRQEIALGVVQGGSYLWIGLDEQQRLTASSNRIGTAQTFVVRYVGGSRIALRSRATGRYVSLRADGTLVADALLPLAREIFRHVAPVTPLVVQSTKPLADTIRIALPGAEIVVPYLPGILDQHVYDALRTRDVTLTCVTADRSFSIRGGSAISSHGGLRTALEQTF
ncbi:hypothetical protein [Micromonospora coxensis]|uniref:Glycosyl hydrolase family 49 n=1 Tax=Micromonospora coxensis TaxID=356852 RepID=A0A1C5GVQ7_9ACTN|nr:hypothetical protein [Micromonospora coxensis]SCG37793.1 Glycosyl hydrolase family 49 [Micromonospora coxensis]